MLLGTKNLKGCELFLALQRLNTQRGGFEVTLLLLEWKSYSKRTPKEGLSASFKESVEKNAHYQS